MSNPKTRAKLLKPGGILSAVPVELFVMIHSCLPKVSQVQLGLACKAYFATLYPKGRIRLSIRHRRDLFLSLEKDIPERSWCPYCNRLCPFKSTSKERWLDQDHSLSCKGLIEASGKDSFNQPLGYNLVNMGVHFMDAHLIMNAQRYGERHGLPMSVMNNAHSDEYEAFPWYDEIPVMASGLPNPQPSSTHEDTTGRQDEVAQGKFFKWPSLPPEGPTAPSRRTKWRISRQQTTRVIKGELYVAIHYKASAPTGLSYKLATLLNYWDIPFCYHMTFRKALMSVRNTGYYYLFEHRLNPCEGRVVSCMACYTDASITISGAEQESESDVEVITYHRLGRCRRPDEAVWKTFTLPPGAMTTAQMRSADAGYPKGEVQNRWKMSGGQSVKPSKVSWGPPGAILTGMLVRPDSFWLG